MSERIALVVVSAAFGLVLVAGVLISLENAPLRLSGGLLLLGGAAIAASARSLNASRYKFAKLPVFLQRLVGLRPITLVLWGSGVAMLGVLLVSGIVA